MGKFKKNVSDGSFTKHKKIKPLKGPINPSIKKRNRSKKKKHSVNDLHKHQNHDIRKSNDKSSEKERKNKKDTNINRKAPYVFQTNSVSSTNNSTTPSAMKKVKHKNRKYLLPLRERMLTQLKAARFRFINERLYTSDINSAQEIFKEDPSSFEAYHEGYKQQIKQWPLNPLDVIIKSLQSRGKSGKLVIADFGCGEAQLASALPDARVHSFDLVAANNLVTVCNMAHTPLKGDSIDVAVFCLSLMGTNLSDFIKEANRVLKQGGLMKIAEVESRFDNVTGFIKIVERFGFEPVSQDLSHNLFYFLDFKKTNNISPKRKNKLPELALKPCFYKKR